MKVINFIIGAIALVATVLLGSTFYLSSQAQSTFNSSIDAIAQKHPFVNIQTQKYNKGFFSSSNEMELTLGCEDTPFDELISFRLNNSISHIPVGLGGLRSASIHTKITPNDKLTRKLAKLMDVTELATLDTKMGFSGGYKSTLNIPATSISLDENGGISGEVFWDAISYKIDKHSRYNPNYAYQANIPKIELSLADKDADINFKMSGFKSQSSSSQTISQNIPTQSLGTSSIETIDVSAKMDDLEDITLKVRDYNNKSEIESNGDLLLFKTHASLSGQLNNIELDNVDITSKLSNVEYRALNKLIQTYSDMLTGCKAVAEDDIEETLEVFADSIQALAEHNPAYLYTATIHKQGKKADITLKQELKDTLLAFSSGGDLFNVSKFLDGGHLSVTMPKTWMDDSALWLGETLEGEFSQDLYSEAKAQMISNGYLLEDGDNYSTKITWTKGDIYANDNKLSGALNSDFDDISQEKYSPEIDYNSGYSDDYNHSATLYDSDFYNNEYGEGSRSAAANDEVAKYYQQMYAAEAEAIAAAKEASSHHAPNHMVEHKTLKAQAEEARKEAKAAAAAAEAAANAAMYEAGISP